jgi:hypothetical protein
MTTTTTEGKGTKKMASKKKTAKKGAKKAGKTAKKVGRKKAVKKGGREKSPATVGGPRKCSLCGVRGHNRRGHDAWAAP